MQKQQIVPGEMFNGKKPRVSRERPNLLVALPEDIVIFILIKLCSSANCPSDFINIVLTYFSKQFPYIYVNILHVISFCFQQFNPPFIDIDVKDSSAWVSILLFCPTLAQKHWLSEPKTGPTRLTDSSNAVLPQVVSKPLILSEW